MHATWVPWRSPAGAADSGQPQRRGLIGEEEEKKKEGFVGNRYRTVPAPWAAVGVGVGVGCGRP